MDITKETRSAVMRWVRAQQKTPPNPKGLKPCPLCGGSFGVRELRIHKPLCRRENKLKIAIDA